MTTLLMTPKYLLKHLACTLCLVLASITAGGQEANSATPSPLGDSFTNSLGMKFVKVPGTQVMFCIWDVRVQDYRAYVEANPDSGIDENWKNPGFKQGDTHPVVNVNWTDARNFCRWLSRKEGRKYRLPMDEEWSTAVGLPNETGDTPKDKYYTNKFAMYPWGNTWPPPDNSGNYDDFSDQAIPGLSDGFDRTSPVGSFKANQFGLYDLGGNVSQWCEDWYDDEQRQRVSRGGDWISKYQIHLLSACRGSGSPSGRYNFIGFRIVLVNGFI